MSIPQNPSRDCVLDLLRRIQSAQFVIPVYQRNYTWIDKKHVRQLLDDLNSILDNTYQKHFLGILIYLERSASIHYHELSVIDGQQRLTTIFLMLYAIRDLLRSKNRKEEANIVEQTYLLNLVYNTPKYKLKPLVSDDDVYRQIVEGDLISITQKESNVYKNYIYIRKEFSALEVKYDLFTDVLDAINKMYLVCVPIYEDDYPQRVFESINATGVALTASDLIRNYLLMPENSQNQEFFYEKYWRRVEELISSDSKKLEAFFRFFVMTKEMDTINKNATYRSFVTWHKAHFEEMHSDGIFSEIIRYAVIYNQLYVCPPDQIQSELRDAITEFRENKSDMPASLLMELISISGNQEEYPKTIKIEDIAQIIYILNSYLMRRSLCGMDTSDISRYFPDLLRALLNKCNGDYTSIVDNFKVLLIDSNRNSPREMPDDKTVRDRIVSANMYSLKEWVFIFLRKLEMKDNPAPVDFSKLSIEHLMPQTPNVAWLGKLGVTKDEYDRYLNRLGNLTFATKPDNSRMQNKEWDFKKVVLSNTGHLKINSALLALDEWNFKSIDKRTDDLIDRIIELYPYYAPDHSQSMTVPIYIYENEAYAIGSYDYCASTITIDKSSILSSMSSDVPDADTWIADWRQELMDNDVLIVNKDGELEFGQTYTFVNKKIDGSDYFCKIASLIIGKTIIDKFDMWRTEGGMTFIDYTCAHVNEIKDFFSQGNNTDSPKGKLPRLRFSMIGINIGDELTFTPTGEIVEICSDNKVRYCGKEYKLSQFAKEFMPDDMRNASESYQGGKFFSYKGKILTDMREEKTFTD